MSGHGMTRVGNGLTEASVGCKICGAVKPFHDPSVKGVHISVVSGEVVLDEVDVPLSPGDTIEWFSRDGGEWSVEFMDPSIKPHTYSGQKCGFKILGLPPGKYKYNAFIKGVASSADGSLTVS